MRSTIVVLLLSALAISAVSAMYKPTLGLNPLPPKYKIIQTRAIKETPEFNDVVSYLEYNLSPNDINEMLDALPEALEAANDDVEANDEERIQPRSVGSVIENAFEHIPWGKITEVLQKMAKKDSKFYKVLNLVNDQKFRELVKKAVNSHTLAQFVKDVAEHGFSWTEFASLLIHALCSTATTIQHDKYSVGVCQVLQHL